MIVCVLHPRFELTVAASRRDALASLPAPRNGGCPVMGCGPLALAPEPGREQRIGEVSAAAEAFGVQAGMMLGEALARCAVLELVPADPVGVAERWETTLRALESHGAAVESIGPGIAYFSATGLLGLHGGDMARLLTAVRRSLDGPARLGAGPTRFCALAAASTARPRRPVVVTDRPQAVRRHLDPQPVALLRSRPATTHLVEPLQRLGVRTLGELARLPRDAMADRFGAEGVLAHRLALGEDEPLRPRRRSESLSETLELPESASGPQLERALDLLLDRLLARHRRRGRTLRVMVIAARLVEGGTWRERVVFREALSDPARMRLALTPRLALLPAPAEALRLSVERFGPPASDQRALLAEARTVRRESLREAVRQARAVAGGDAALRVLCVDRDSRVPERRVLLAPFEA
jgi:protein ImuB